MQQSATISTHNMISTKKVSFAETLTANAHWLLRLSLSSVFVYHGFNKFADLGGFEPSLQHGAPGGSGRIGGGILVFVGAFTKGWITRVGAAMFVPVMAGAIFMVHWPQWSFVPSSTHPMGGMEFQVVLILLSLYVVIRGNRP